MKKIVILVAIVLLVFAGCNSMDAENSVIESSDNNSGISQQEKASSTLSESASSSKNQPLTNSEAEESIIDVFDTYSEEDFTNLRQSMPYIPANPNDDSYVLSYPIVSDECGKRLADFIQKVNQAISPDESFDSPSEAQNFIRSSSVFATNFFTLGDPDSYVYNVYKHYQLQLEPFMQINNDNNIIYLKEHVEQTAKLLFGQDTVITHDNGRLVNYSELAGIYWPAFMGMEVGRNVVLLSYEELPDEYMVEAVFPLYTDEKYLFLMENQDYTMAEFIEYCSGLDRHRIVIKKEENGLFSYQSHILPEK